MFGVSTEGRDVLLHPGQHSDHVEQAVVSGRAASSRGERRNGQEAQDSNPVLSGHHDRAVRCQRRHIEGWCLRVAAKVAASMNEYHHWLSRARWCRRNKNIQRETIFVAHLLPIIIGLRAHIAKRRRVLDSGPTHRRLWWLPPQGAERWCGIRDTTEGDQVTRNHSSHGS